MKTLTLALLAASALAACASTPPAAAPADQFMQSLRRLCGNSYAGRLTTTDPADAAFASQPLVVRVQCTDDAVRMPLAVGPDRSRTWVVTRTASGLRLKHDHRHADGTPDEITNYGGDTVSPGTASRQDFPADAFSKDLFSTRGNPASITNIWSLQLEPGRTLAYELRRPGRHFRVEFDLTRPLPAS